ncbi:MAG: helix-turn-helix domain-containing protein [Halolamina sp.]|uniref:helix-turn-helix domain-containing protein n=1 Tax=Halolamina sp. TaxID=1940283 RepID=UPI002FC3BD00
MSHPVSVRTDRRSSPPSEETVHTEGEISELLAVMDDEDCRAVLEATGSEPLSAKEIAQRCDLASSTAYRKIDRLVDAGLLTEGIRISGTGKHASEYRRSVDRIELSIGDAGTELQVERGSVDQAQPAD